LPSGKRAYDRLIAAFKGDDEPIRIISITEGWSAKKPYSPGKWERAKTLVIEYQNVSNDVIYLACQISYPRQDGKIVTIESTDSVCPPGMIRKRPIGNAEPDKHLTLSRVMVLDRDKAQLSAKEADIALQLGGHWIGRTFCVVATTCFGSEAAPEVEILRHFRDTVLFERRGGRVAIRLYEHAGPGIARTIERHPALRARVRSMLARLARWLARRYDLG